MEVLTHKFLALAVDGSECSAMRPKLLNFLHKHAVPAGWAPKVEIKTCVSAESRTPVVHPVAQPIQC